MQLICVFLFTYAKSRFSQDMAQIAFHDLLFQPHDNKKMLFSAPAFPSFILFICNNMVFDLRNSSPINVPILYYTPNGYIVPMEFRVHFFLA